MMELLATLIKKNRQKNAWAGSMTQQRLNHCNGIPYSQERTGALDLFSIAKEFAQANEGGLLFLRHLKSKMFWSILKFTYLL